MHAPAPAPIGAVAHYNLLERLESTGPGDLFRARDARLGRTVAVRLLPVEWARAAAARASLVERARSCVALSHANITTLFDVGEHEGRVYVVFEFLTGRSLRADMAGRPMNVRRAVELAIQMANAVADMHAAGFVHRGLSPDSVAITSKGHAKIPPCDLAARFGFDDSVAEVRLRDYGSPEEARGQQADERSDVYSVGAVLYEMLTTRRPLHRGASAPSASNRNVPPAVDTVVLKAVAPNAALRIQSAAVLAAELRAATAIPDGHGGAEKGDDPEAPTTGIGRTLLVTIAIALGLAVLAWWTVR